MPLFVADCVTRSIGYRKSTERQVMGMAAKRLRLGKSNRMLLGVCSGLGRFLGIDATVLRLIWVAAAFYFGIFECFVAYIIVGIVLSVSR